MRAFQDELEKDAVNLQTIRSLGQRALGATGKALKGQLHGFTGWVPKGHKTRGAALEALGVSPRAAASKRVQDLARTGWTNSSGQASRKMRAATKHLEYATKAEKMGLTSLPGYAKSLVKNPVDTLRTGMGQQWHSGAMGKAWLGMPVASAAYSLATPNKKGPDGQPTGGRLERAGKSLGELAYSAAPLPMMPAMVAATAASKVLGKAGKKAGDAFKKKAPPGPPEEESAQENVERHYSPAALNQRPGDMIV